MNNVVPVRKVSGKTVIGLSCQYKNNNTTYTGQSSRHQQVAK